MVNRRKYKIVVVGAGAIGGLAGSHLSHSGYEVTLTDKWEEHINVMQNNGLDIDGVRGDKHIDVQACLTTKLTSPLEMLIISVKSQNTIEAMEAVKHLVTPETIIVSLQNGFNIETLQKYANPSQIIGTVPNYGGALVNPGHIEFVHEGPIHIGELNGTKSPRVRWLKEAFEKLTDTYISTNIVGEIWGKQCYFSQITLTALVDAPIHHVLDVEKYRRLGIILVGEVLDVAAAAGISIPATVSFDPSLYRPKTAEDMRRINDYWDGYLNVLSRHSENDPHQYVKTASGVWWDIVYRKRPSETRKGLTGTMVEKARQYNVPVPLNERLVEMIYQIESGERISGWENLDELDDYRQELGLDLP
jgi:2-dehydropantoate 2-reductase